MLMGIGGIISYINVRKPTQDEWDSCHHPRFDLASSDLAWEPSLKSYAEQEDTVSERFKCIKSVTSLSTLPGFHISSMSPRSVMMLSMSQAMIISPMSLHLISLFLSWVFIQIQAPYEPNPNLMLTIWNSLSAGIFHLTGCAWLCTIPPRRAFVSAFTLCSPADTSQMIGCCVTTAFPIPSLLTRWLLEAPRLRVTSMLRYMSRPLDGFMHTLSIPKVWHKNSVHALLLWWCAACYDRGYDLGKWNDRWSEMIVTNVM